MKRLKTFLSPRKLTLILAILVLVVSISFVNRPAQSVTQGIVSTVAVDYQDGQIKLACSIITPTSDSGGSNMNMYTSKAPTIAEAVEMIGMQLGKDLGFAQCDIVAIGDNLAKNNVVDALDYFSRTKRVGRNVLLLAFEGETNEFVEGVIYMEEKLSLTISQILNYNKEYLLAVDSNLENFFMGYYGDSGISLVPKIVITDEETDDGIKVELKSSSSEQAMVGEQGLGGNGESGQKQSKDVYFVNSGKTSVIKNGKNLFDLMPRDVKNLNLYFKNSKYGTFTLDNISDEYYDDATIVLKMESKKVNFKYKFVDGKPKFVANIKVYVEISEIVEESKNEKLLKRIDALITKNVQDKLKSQLEDDLKSIMKKLKTMNVDCLQLYSNFNKYHHKKWEKYLSELDNKDEYLKDIELDVKVEIAQFI